MAVFEGLTLSCIGEFPFNSISHLKPKLDLAYFIEISDQPISDKLFSNVITSLLYLTNAVYVWLVISFVWTNILI